MGKILITGGAGFIGSHLTERLLADGYEVYVLDNLSTGSLDNLAAVEENPRLHVVVDGIENQSLLNRLAEKVDIIYHLAAAVGVKLIVKEPVETIETNIAGAENVMKAALNEKVKKIFLASTSEVYGKGTTKKFAEDDDLIFGATTRNRWSYGCSKAIDEFLALAYHQSKGLPIIIGRLFNTVGPRQVGNYGMVIPRFVQKALAGEPIEVYGDGAQVRCFTHVTDIIEALCLLLNKDSATGEIFNIGSDEPITIRQLAEKVKALVNPDVEIKHIPYARAYGPGFEDIKIRRPDISKLEKAIGFKPSISLDEIICDVMEYMQQCTK